MTPGGLSFERGRCTIQLVKNINRQNRTMPTEQFGGGVPETFAFHYVPRVFGDYTAAPEQFLPTVNLGGGRYFIADPDDIQSIGTVKDGDGNDHSHHRLHRTTRMAQSRLPPSRLRWLYRLVGAEDADYEDTGRGLGRLDDRVSNRGGSVSIARDDFDDLHDADGRDQGAGLLRRAGRTAPAAGH